MKKYNRQHIGKEFTTNEGYKAIVIDGGSKLRYCTIQIEDWVKEVIFSSIEKGAIKYPYHPSVYGVGYLGEGKYSNKTHKKIYKVWQSLLTRCYCPKYQQKKPTYIGVVVCKEWHNLQTFGKWMDNYYPTDGSKYELDKDLKSGDAKIYSPLTAMFIPQHLNVFMATTYSSNTSGHTGVCWDKESGKWIAGIFIDSRRKHLGFFTDIKEASEVYKQARDRQVKRWQRFYSFDYPKVVLNRLQ